MIIFRGFQKEGGKGRVKINLEEIEKGDMTK